MRPRKSSVKFDVFVVDREVVDAAIRRRDPCGHLAGLDHLVPIEFTFQRFKEYADYIKTQLAIE